MIGYFFLKQKDRVISKIKKSDEGASPNLGIRSSNDDLVLFFENDEHIEEFIEQLNINFQNYKNKETS